MKDMIKDIIITVALVLVIILTTRTGFNLLTERDAKLQEYAIEFAREKGKAAVTVDELNVYDEIPFEHTDGDVITIEGTDVKVKLSGTLTDDTMASYGYYTYSSYADHLSMTINYEIRKNAIDKFHNAQTDYWHTTPDTLVEFYGLAYEGAETDFVYYQQTHRDGNIPVVYNNITKIYYMFIDRSDYFIILSANEPFIVTDEKATVHYGDPNANPMRYHTYSAYEEVAAYNTRQELLNPEEGEIVDNPYQTGDVVGTAGTYTSNEDNAIRSQMVSLANYKWNDKGQSTETSLAIDFMSEEAKKSEWVLTSTTYSYEKASLKISALNASRSETEFSLTGNINNGLGTERPYVIVVKYIGKDGNLLGIKVIDKRAEPLAQNGVSTFGVTVRSDKDNINIADITALQFDIY